MKEKPDGRGKKSCSPPGVRHSTKASCTQARKFLSLLSICVHVVREIFRCTLRRSGRPTVAVQELAEDFLFFLIFFSTRWASHDNSQAVKGICLVCVHLKRISGVEGQVLPCALKSDLYESSHVSSAWSRGTFRPSNTCHLFCPALGWTRLRKKASLTLYHLFFFNCSEHRDTGVMWSFRVSACTALAPDPRGRWPAGPLGIAQACTLSTVWYAWGHINSFCSHLWFPVSLCPPHKSWPGGCRGQLPMWKLTGPSKKAMALLTHWYPHLQRRAPTDCCSIIRITWHISNSSLSSLSIY